MNIRMGFLRGRVRLQTAVLTTVLFMITVIPAVSQEKVKGSVIDQQGVPLGGASIYWYGTTNGTVSDGDGKFAIPVVDNSTKLIVSFIGYTSDTLEISDLTQGLKVRLLADQQLDEVTVSERQRGEYISRIQTIQTQTITEKGLQKMPCCNLSESFENSATVDVGFTDAVSGAKQIKMLGLDGKYSQIMVEKRPGLRGLSSGFGLMYIPGSWMEGIQIAKGTGSVTDGYESITGQINLEFKKPENSNPLHVNLYSNIEGRLEANVLAAAKVSDSWSTMLLTSGGHMGTEHDKNNDGFLDAPMTDQIHVMNRWKYINGNVRFQTGFSILDEKRNGGQIGYQNSEGIGSGLYGVGIDTKKYEAFAKGGIPFKSDRFQSLAIITSGVYHEINSFFGNRSYHALQKSIYASMVYYGELWNTKNTLTSGISVHYDDFDDEFESMDLGRTETIPGIYSEYNFKSCKTNIIAGLRYDYSTLFGAYLTPRFHSKFQLLEETVLRASVGRGHRVPNLIIENIGLLVSSRDLIIEEEIKPEDAWNAGVNLTHDFLIAQKEFALSLDYYRTQFVNQLIVDMEQDRHSIHFYNLDGTSYSNSFQTELSVKLMEGLDISGAFRINDVNLTLNDELQEKPFVNRYKGLLTSSYASRFEKWVFDVTAQYNGRTRLPDIYQNMNIAEPDYYSPNYYILHAQITRKFKYFSVYLGGENLSNFKQENPIIDPENPFGENFDASRVWGPIMGRILFLGARFDIE
jgi:outer membrane receptor for ferrienterochelin and colicins